MKELLSQFGVDWKLLIAQVVNFFILFILLKKFAYKPIIKMLNERRRRIEEGVKASEESKRRLAESSEFEKQIILKAEKDAEKIVNDGEARAREQSGQIVKAAESKSEQVIIAGQKKVEEERLKMAQNIEAETEHLIQKGLARVIGKMSHDERDRALIAEALRELKTVTK